MEEEVIAVAAPGGKERTVRGHGDRLCTAVEGELLELGPRVIENVDRPARRGEDLIRFICQRC